MVLSSADAKLMPPAQAGEALRFVEEHKADVGTVAVHSESGMSPQEDHRVSIHLRH